MAITEADLTPEIFKQYGMTALPPVEAFKLLDSEEPEILVYVEDEIIPEFETHLYTSEVYFALSADDTSWYIYRNGVWVDTTETEFLKLEYTANEMAAIPQTELESKFGDKKIHFRACMISNKENVEAKITNIYAVSVQSYFMGSGYTFSGDDMTLDTKLWTAIESCTVSMMTYPGAVVKFAVSADKTHWKILKDGQWYVIGVNEVLTKGMTAEQLMAVKESEWDYLIADVLRLCVAVSSPDKSKTPKVYSVLFTYRGYEDPTTSNTIEIVTPKYVYNRCILSPTKYIYEEFPVEGIGFDSPDELYNFYTTPNKIVLRVLNMGTLIGTKMSEIFKCVIVNTWEKRDYNVELTMKTDVGVAITKPSYCLLRDADSEANMTVGELSYKPPENFTPEYPLKMRLNAQERKIFYFRLTPTSTTVGTVEAKIVATALEISS